MGVILVFSMNPITHRWTLIPAWKVNDSNHRFDVPLTRLHHRNTIVPTLHLFLSKVLLFQHLTKSLGIAISLPDEVVERQPKLLRGVRRARVQILQAQFYWWIKVYWRHFLNYLYYMRCFRLYFSQILKLKITHTQFLP